MHGLHQLDLQLNGPLHADHMGEGDYLLCRWDMPDLAIEMARIREQFIPYTKTLKYQLTSFYIEKLTVRRSPGANYLSWQGSI